MKVTFRNKALLYVIGTGCNFGIEDPEPLTDGKLG